MDPSPPPPPNHPYSHLWSAKHAADVRMLRDREEREKAEQERERLEKMRGAEQAVDKHFEESLRPQRLAQHKQRSSVPSWTMAPAFPPNNTRLVEDPSRLRDRYFPSPSLHPHARLPTPPPSHPPSAASSPYKLYNYLPPGLPSHGGAPPDVVKNSVIVKNDAPPPKKQPPPSSGYRPGNNNSLLIEASNLLYSAAAHPPAHQLYKPPPAKAAPLSTSPYVQQLYRNPPPLGAPQLPPPPPAHASGTTSVRFLPNVSPPRGDSTPQSMPLDLGRSASPSPPKRKMDLHCESVDLSPAKKSCPPQQEPLALYLSHPGAGTDRNSGILHDRNALHHLNIPADIRNSGPHDRLSSGTIPLDRSTLVHLNTIPSDRNSQLHHNAIPSDRNAQFHQSPIPSDRNIQPHQSTNPSDRNSQFHLSTIPSERNITPASAIPSDRTTTLLHQNTIPSERNITPGAISSDRNTLLHLSSIPADTSVTACSPGPCVSEPASLTTSPVPASLTTSPVPSYPPLVPSSVVLTNENSNSSTGSLPPSGSKTESTTSNSSSGVHKLKKAWLQRHSGVESTTPPPATLTPPPVTPPPSTPPLHNVPSPAARSTPPPSISAGARSTPPPSLGGSISAGARSTPPPHSVGSLPAGARSTPPPLGASISAGARSTPPPVGARDSPPPPKSNASSVNGHGGGSTSSEEEELAKRVSPKVKRKKKKKKTGSGSSSSSSTPVPPVDSKKPTASSTDSDKESTDSRASSKKANGNNSPSKSNSQGANKGSEGGSGGSSNNSSRKRGKKGASSSKDSSTTNSPAPPDGGGGNGDDTASSSSGDRKSGPPPPPRDPFQKPSVAQLKRTGESWLQDGPCYEVAPKLAKCRECRWTQHQRSRNSAANIFCRFYAFRRLRYTKNGMLAIAGFSDPHKDAGPEDVSLWLPDPERPPADIDEELGRFILLQLAGQFCDLLRQEEEALELNLAEDGAVAWKRVVQGVREMCDVCETTLFNFHWACSKCGFVVCIDCYRDRKTGCSKVWGDGGRDRDEASWLLCNNRQPHEQEKLMLTQIIAGKCLQMLGEKMNEYKLANNITLYFKPDKDKKVKEEKPESPLDWLADVALNKQNNTNAAPPTTTGGGAGSATTEGGEVKAEPSGGGGGGFSKLRKLLIRRPNNPEEKPETGGATEMSSESSSTSTPVKTEPGCESTPATTDAAGSGPANSQTTEAENSNSTMVQLKHFQRRKNYAWSDSNQLDIRILTNTESQRLYPDVPHAWLCDGKLLRLTDPRCPGNYKIFQDMWRRGQPVLVSGVGAQLDPDLWHPDSFATDFGSLRNDLVNCATGLTVPNQSMAKFWAGFEHVGHRLKDDQGRGMLLKLKDWPPGEDFAELLPTRFADLMRVLPLGEYTQRTGRLNLASRLPECFVKPDLGPKMYIAYGNASLLPSKATTNLHLDISDAVNLMVYVGIPKDGDHSEYMREAYRAIHEERCDILTQRRVRVQGELPGALWHIFAPRDADKIRDLLNKVAIEKGAILERNHDSIHDQSWYLDKELRDRLNQEYKVQAYTIVQCLGDAVFVPAGAPHQVRNLHSCIKVAEDFVSPENVSHCFHLTQEFRELSDTHSNHEDKLQVKNIIFHAVKDSLSVVEASERKNRAGAGGEGGTNGASSSNGGGGASAPPTSS